MLMGTGDQLQALLRMNMIACAHNRGPGGYIRKQQQRQALYLCL